MRARAAGALLALATWTNRGACPCPICADVRRTVGARGGRRAVRAAWRASWRMGAPDTKRRP